jgi:hypothetical protein
MRGSLRGLRCMRLLGAGLIVTSESATALPRATYLLDIVLALARWASKGEPVLPED